MATLYCLDIEGFFFLPPALHHFYIILFKAYCRFFHLPPSLPLSSSPRSNYKMLFCAAETMQEIYWLWVPPFDTQDAANRSCAISPLLRLPCKTDLSYLQAIFKLWEQETYGAMGNFIIGALHLSDLIQAWCRPCQSTLYFHTLLRQTRPSLTINTSAAVTAGGAFLQTVPRRNTHKIRGSIYSTHDL